MAEIQHPGVYLEEVDGPKPIPGVPTSDAAVLGWYESGPWDRVVGLTSPKMGETKFGLQGKAMDAIRQFFANGGEKCWVVRVEPGAKDPVGAICNGLKVLDNVNFNQLCIPDTSEMVASTAVDAIKSALDYCEERRAFLLIDPPHILQTPTDILSWLQNNPQLQHPNAALYYPRLIVPDPCIKSQLGPAAASGTIAGVIARVDKQTGVWSPPAGNQATLVDVSALERKLNDEESALLNSHGVNCLREFPGRGIVAWGSRTTSDSPEWKYVSVRRLMLFVELSIHRGLQWAVFEPNDEPLWALVRNFVQTFLNDVWLNGALQGKTPDEAYFVKVDRTTMTQDDIDNGRLIVVIGVAPLKPAEFVIIRIGLWAREHYP